MSKSGNSSPEPEKDFVRNKIKRQAQKSGSSGSHARKEIRSLAKVIKKAKSIAELLTEDDQEENLRVIREAKRATHKVFDVDQKKLVEQPDHKTRLAAVTLDLAYREGTPVARSISATGSLRDMKELLDRTDSSPAYQESLQKEAEGKENSPLLEIPPSEIEIQPVEESETEVKKSDDVETQSQ
ncbi:MAG TPA: hypothetical protein VFA85_12770 [Terriglobales bacterium]|nr:hypothetical protein [Terriglobales bacterium]